MTGAHDLTAEPEADVAPKDRPDRPGTSTPSPPVPLQPADRRRLRWAWAAGTLPLLVLYAWMVTAGQGALFQGGVFTEDFYDVQARSFFEGRLDVDADAVSMEGFLIDGKTYTYFGPFPSLARMPILAVTDTYDGTLAALFMLIATVVLAVTGFRLLCVLRATIRGNAPVDRAEVVLTGLLGVATLASPTLFLVSARLVYHEASLWGAALTVAGFASVARWQRDPTGRQLTVAAVVIALALMSRQAVAAGPLLALALAGLVHLQRLDRRRPAGLDPGARARRLAPTVAALATAGVLAMVPSVVVHYAKFGQIYNLPMDRHIQSLEAEHFENRAEVLAAHSNMQGPEYITSTSYQYLRPDALRFRADFPWIDFPAGGPVPLDRTIIFDELDWSSSITSTMPVPTVLALVAAASGTLHLIRRHRARRSPDDGTPDNGEADNGTPDDGEAATDPDERRPPTWPLVVGAAFGCFAVLQLGYIANRYLADLVPLLLVAGFIGAHRLLVLLDTRRPAIRRSVLGGLALLTLASVLVNAALALSYQRERGHARQPEQLAEYIGWRLSLPGDPPVEEVPSEAGHPWAFAQLPELEDGTLLIIGDCEQLLTRVGATSLGSDQWVRVEEAPEDSLCRRAQELL
jgi:hypothetical protein